MIILLNAVVILIGLYLIYTLILKRVGFSFHAKKLTKQASYVIEYNNKIAKRKEFIKNLIVKLEKFYSSIVLFRLTENEIESLDYIATRMDASPFGVKATYSFYYVVRCTIISAYIIGVCIASLFNTKFVLLLAFYGVVGSLFDQFMRSEISALDEEIEIEFSDFYSVFYYPLQHKSNKGLRLDDIARSYEPRAGKQMKILIKNFVADCAESEMKALNNLKKNYSIPNIHRFAGLMVLVINGQGSAIQAMNSFYEELDIAEDDYLDKQLEKRKRTADKVMGVAWFMLIEVFAMWCIFSLANAGN